MLPSLSILERIQQRIKYIPNQRKESKRKAHFCLFLLGYQAGLRVSEAISFDLSAKTKEGLYRLDKPKGKKERYVYVPPEVISELKKNDWKPNQTNRFNFYHFLRKIKKDLGIPPNVELTPHTLRRAFATYHAESGLPLPLLQKLLGHASIRTTALYWMNIYNEDDISDILTAKNWPEKPPLEPENSVKINLGEMPVLLEPMPCSPPPNYLSKVNQLESQLSQISNENNSLKSELAWEKEQNIDLQQDLNYLNEQNANLDQEKAQIQQDLTITKETISQLTQDLTDERKKRTTAEDNLFTQKQINQSLRETNANLTQKIQAYEQNHTNLQNAYQNALKDKQTAELLAEKEKQRVDNYETQLKAIAKSLYQWQKLNYYQQLEKERSEQQAQIIQPNFKPPPWKKS